MSTGTLQTISIVSFALTGLLLAIAVFLYFRMNVKTILDDLSGKTAAQQIRKLREGNIQPLEYVSSRDLFEQETEHTTDRLKAKRHEEGTMPLTEYTDAGIGTELLTSNTESSAGGFQIVREHMEIHTKERI